MHPNLKSIGVAEQRVIVVRVGKGREVYAQFFFNLFFSIFYYFIN